MNIVIVGSLAHPHICSGVCGGVVIWWWWIGDNGKHDNSSDVLSVGFLYNWTLVQTDRSTAVQSGVCEIVLHRLHFSHLLLLLWGEAAPAPLSLLAAFLFFLPPPLPPCSPPPPLSLTHLCPYSADPVPAWASSPTDHFIKKTHSKTIFPQNSHQLCIFICSYSTFSITLFY